jgi:hypothetical protein
MEEPEPIGQLVTEMLWARKEGVMRRASKTRLRLWAQP